MAGHSKWHNIQHRKNAQDAKRGKIFTKLIREITVAAKMGGGDLDANPRLRTAVDKALAANMTKDTIERAVKRGSGDVGGDDYAEIRYEGYGPGGVAIIVDCLTDNRNRTVSEVRHAFSKHGGNLGTEGSVSYMFNKIGSLVFHEVNDEEVLLDAALEAGADDVITEDDVTEVLTDPSSFTAVKDALTAAGHTPEEAEITFRADNDSELDQKSAETFIKLVDALEDLDDVQNVYHNGQISDAVMEALEG
jgi:YebC/PmpR family DNA-binding regulatory protein